MKIQQPKKPETRQRWISCLKEPTFCQKSQLVKLAKKLRKSQLLRTNLDPNWYKIATFWDKGGTIDPHVTYPPLETCAYEQTDFNFATKQAVPEWKLSIQTFDLKLCTPLFRRSKRAAHVKFLFTLYRVIAPGKNLKLISHQSEVRTMT